MFFPRNLGCSPSNLSHALRVQVYGEPQMFQRLDRSITNESLATRICGGVLEGIFAVARAKPNGSDSPARGLIWVKISRGIPAFAALSTLVAIGGACALEIAIGQSDHLAQDEIHRPIQLKLGKLPAKVPKSSLNHSRYCLLLIDHCQPTMVNRQWQMVNNLHPCRCIKRPMRSRAISIFS